jgi:hypothetical protein
MPAKGKDKQFAGKDPKWVRRYQRSHGIGRPRGRRDYPGAALRDWSRKEAMAADKRGKPLPEADVWEFAEWLVEDGEKSTIWAALKSVLEAERRKFKKVGKFRDYYGIWTAEEDMVEVVARRLVARDRRYKETQRLMAEMRLKMNRRRQRRAAAKLQ